MLPRIQRTEWEVVGSTELVGTELAAAPELGEMHGRDPFELRPRRRHGRRSRARGSGGIEATGRNRRGKEGGEAWELTAVP